jgi:hypothetical protein
MSIRITPQAFAVLQGIRDRKKFVAERFYPGAPTEQIRLRCEASVNGFLDEVLSALQRGANKQELFEHTRKLRASFAQDDPEEREKADDYVGEMMRTIGIDDWIDFV